MCHTLLEAGESGEQETPALASWGNKGCIWMLAWGQVLKGLMHQAKKPNQIRTKRQAGRLLGQEKKPVS